MTPQIVCTGSHRLSAEATALLEAEGAQVRFLPMVEAEELAEACRDADAVITFMTPVTAPAIMVMKRCRIIARLGVGYDSVDFETARQASIPVTNVPDYCTEDVADHALALALMLSRGLPFLDRAVREDVWLPQLPYPIPTSEEQTFGVIGFGRIGKMALARARGFGFRLAACDPYVADAEFAAAGVTRLSLEDVLAESDILSLHVPLTTETYHLLNAERLARMKPTAIFVNTARGAAVDNNALAEALLQKRLGAAGLDVFEEEPLPDTHPLRSLPNVVLSPHFAWHSTRAERRLHLLGAEEVVRALRGEPLRCCINGL